MISVIVVLCKCIDFAQKIKKRTSSPTYIYAAKKSQIGSFTNKRTIFFKSLTSNSFLQLYMFMDGDMKKKSLS